MPRERQYCSRKDNSFIGNRRNRQCQKMALPVSICILNFRISLQKLMNRETRTKVEADDASYIGISGQEVTSEVVELYGLPAGIYITSVGPDTPAEEAGLEEGMILTALDDYEITSMSDLQGVLEYYSGGETVTLTVCEQSRQGGYEEKQLEITLGYKSDYMSHRHRYSSAQSSCRSG